MTRKHFEKLAMALASIRPPDPAVFALTDGGSAYRTWQNGCNRIASVCAESNPRFDRDQFIKATEA